MSQDLDWSLGRFRFGGESAHSKFMTGTIAGEIARSQQVSEFSVDWEKSRAVGIVSWLPTITPRIVGPTVHQ